MSSGLPRPHYPLNPDAVRAALEEQAADLNPAWPLDELLRALATAGVPRFAEPLLQRGGRPERSKRRHHSPAAATGGYSSIVYPTSMGYGGNGTTRVSPFRRQPRRS